MYNQLLLSVTSEGTRPQLEEEDAKALSHTVLSCSH